MPRCMMWVDNMGNLLSNLKLAFYESSEQQSYWFWGGGNERVVRENLVKAYDIVSEIYDDLLTPVRLKQTRCLQELDLNHLKSIN
jgi:hypothetical protein